MNKLLYTVAAVLMIAFPSAAISSPLSHDLIVGKWRHLDMVQTADGIVVRVQESHGETSIEYKTDGTWTFTSPRNNNSGTYHLANKHSLEATILESDIPNQIGWSSVKYIDVTENTLKVVTTYDKSGMEAFGKRPDGTRPKEITVTSRFERMIEK